MNFANLAWQGQATPLDLSASVRANGKLLIARNQSNNIKQNITIYIAFRKIGIHNVLS